MMRLKLSWIYDTKDLADYYDIQMGKGAGAYTCGVTYGNSDRDALTASGADYVIDRIGELLDII